MINDDALHGYLTPAEEAMVFDNDVVKSTIFDLMAIQDSKDRRHYRQIATEAVLSPYGKSKMIQTLWTDMMSRSNIDMGTIPNSKGDITRLDFYKSTAETIECLNNLLEGVKCDELKTTNDLHDIIVSLRSDFDFGYKFDIKFITMTYELLVLSLLEMINVCIVYYTNYLKDVKNIEFKTVKPDKKSLKIVKYTNDFIQSYRNGDWTKMMTNFRKNPKGFLGEIVSQMTGIDKDKLSLSGVWGANGAGKVIVSAAAIVAVVALFFSIRGLIYVFYRSATKINDYVKTQSEFLKFNIGLGNDSAAALAKQQKGLDKLESISNFIETKIIKNDKRASKELEESDKKNFTPQALSTAPDTSGLEIL